jgi:uncharacterized protein (DUF2252 family)
MKKSPRFEPPTPDQRASVLTNARNFKMARSINAYVRGSASNFYDWLAESPRDLPDGPPIWICGDCHVGNLGPVANSKGEVEIQIRDFDQTVIGNPVHDLVRLALSLATAARGSNLPGVVTARMVEQLVEGYLEAFHGDGPLDPSERPKAVYSALTDAQRRTFRHLAREHTESDTVSIPIGRCFWPASEEERRAIELLCERDDLAQLTTEIRGRDPDADVEVLDVAYWMKGCSSLGRLRYAVLLNVGGKAAKGRDLCLLDIKEAATAAAPHDAGLSPAMDNAQRVVTGAKHLSPYLGERMVGATLLERPIFARELLPQDLKLEIEQITADEAVKAARFLAQVVGRAHARQMATPEYTRWRAELSKNHTKNLDAPSWLWSSVVELVAAHERAYLGHCHRYALGE